MIASAVRLLIKSHCRSSQRLPRLVMWNQHHHRLLLRCMGSVPSVSALSAVEAMTATTTTTVTLPPLPTQPRHLAFQGMAEGSMNDLHCCVDPFIDVSSVNTTTTAIDAAAATVDPIRREAGLQVDKMERERLRILQEVAASMSTTSGSSSNNHVPFCVATEEGTLTDLVVLDGPLHSTPEGTTDPIRSFVSSPSQSKIHAENDHHDHDHHQAYQATFDDRGALFFDLDTYESSFASEKDYQTALEHETERRAALEHDKMKRKEQNILQQAASVSSSAGPE